MSEEKPDQTPPPEPPPNRDWVETESIRKDVGGARETKEHWSGE